MCGFSKVQSLRILVVPEQLININKIMMMKHFFLITAVISLLGSFLAESAETRPSLRRLSEPGDNSEFKAERASVSVLESGHGGQVKSDSRIRDSRSLLAVASRDNTFSDNDVDHLVGRLLKKKHSKKKKHKGNWFTKFFTKTVAKGFKDLGKDIEDFSDNIAGGVVTAAWKSPPIRAGMIEWYDVSNSISKWEHTTAGIVITTSLGVLVTIATGGTLLEVCAGVDIAESISGAAGGFWIFGGETASFDAAEAGVLAEGLSVSSANELVISSGGSLGYIMSDATADEVSLEALENFGGNAAGQSLPQQLYIGVAQSSDETELVGVFHGLEDFDASGMNLGGDFEVWTAKEGLYSNFFKTLEQGQQYAAIIGDGGKALAYMLADDAASYFVACGKDLQYGVDKGLIEIGTYSG